jgi:hypothetical protein
MTAAPFALGVSSNTLTLPGLAESRLMRQPIIAGREAANEFRAAALIKTENEYEMGVGLVRRCRRAGLRWGKGHGH